jgi:hypothetical protein
VNPNHFQSERRAGTVRFGRDVPSEKSEEGLSPQARGSHPTIDCAEMPDFIVRYVAASELIDRRPGLRAAIESHLRGCHDCHEKMSALRIALETPSLSREHATQAAWAILSELAADLKEERVQTDD